jgi:cobalt/nickel transport system permease protein
VHLHIPDGVLPPLVWAPALALSLVLLVVSARSRRDARQRVAYQAALGALTLAAMAIEIPLGPLEYHLTLVGPIGVLLGAAGAFEVMFVVNAILALLGHGGFTVVGLNALVLGAGAALARPTYMACARRVKPGTALALGTVVAQASSGVLWLVVVGYALRAGSATAGHAAGAGRLGLVAGLMFPMWLVGIAVESVLAVGIGRFLERVRPDLLPAPRARAAGSGGPEPRDLEAA